MKVAIYSRKSKFTGKGDSVENQVQMCKEYIHRNFSKDEITFEVFEDEGFSGGNTNRPEYQRLLKEIKTNKFDVLICYRLDRISRNVSDFSSTLELLQEYDVDFVSIKEQFDTSTPMGRAMVYISSVFAQLERETIAERVRDNMLELAKSGRWLGGQTPLGFNSEKIVYIDAEYKERTMYKLSPIETELNLVKLIYSKYLKLKSLRKVNQYLLENNFKTKLGANWNVRSVSDVLQNPTYVKADESVFNYLKAKGITCIGNPNNQHGILTYNKKKGQNKYRDKDEWIAAIAKHNGVIEANDWLEIQNTLKDNKTKAPKLGKTHTALLTGLLRCAKCGSPMTVLHGSKDKYGNRRFYYGCSLKIDSKGKRCDNSNIRIEEIENSVISKLKSSTKNTGLLVEELNTVKKQIAATNNTSNELELLNSTLKTNQEAIDNLVKQLSLTQNSSASKYIIAEIENKEKELNETKDKIKSIQETKVQTEQISTDIDLIVSNLKNFYKTIDSVDIEAKKYLISSLVDKITWDSSTGDIDIKLWGCSKKK
ncbi:recombinase family protein [Clostridium niameyense]|uniref:recombinase family protein n=1 Tax=Clostridium niameyense TaxID=1622073 RepID=UPI001969AA83